MAVGRNQITPVLVACMYTFLHIMAEHKIHDFHQLTTAKTPPDTFKLSKNMDKVLIFESLL